MLAADQLPLQKLYHWEKTLGDRLYLTQPLGGGAERTWTWGQTLEETRRIAAFLRAQNWEPGTRVAIMSKNCAWWLLADYAIMMAGHVSVPLYPTLTAHTVRQILEHSESKALFVGKLDDWPTMKPGVPTGVMRIAMPLSPDGDGLKWDEILARTPPLRDSPLRGADELATIVYTSGTTGMPKGVTHRFAAFGYASAAFSGMLDMSPADRMISYLPLAHVAERFMVESNSVHYGFQLFFAESQETFPRDLKRARPTFFFSVPRLWVKFQQGVFAKLPKHKLDRLLRIPFLGRRVGKKILAELGLDSVRAAGGGAAPMPEPLMRWYHSLGLSLYEGYGMTENFGCSHISAPGRERIGYVGELYAGFEQRIAPDGEVLVRMPTMMLGYYKEPAKTREVLTEDGWLHTGDKGEIDAQGRLRITGRVKEIFKTAKGKYVAPAPIESLLSEHPKIEAACVTGASHPQPFAIVILAPDAAKAFGDAALRESLSASLAVVRDRTNAAIDPHEHLDFIAVVPDSWNVDNGFITPTLKVKRAAVEERYSKHFDAWSAQKKPVVWQGL
jgi:long-chain acyl-CoA synthetase